MSKRIEHNGKNKKQDANRKALKISQVLYVILYTLCVLQALKNLGGKKK